MKTLAKNYSILQYTVFQSLHFVFTLMWLSHIYHSVTPQFPVCIAQVLVINT